MHRSLTFLLLICLGQMGLLDFGVSRAHFLTALGVCAKSLQSCLTLCDPVDCSPPGSSVRGILQARILERVAMPSSRGSSSPGD